MPIIKASHRQRSQIVLNEKAEMRLFRRLILPIFSVYFCASAFADPSPPTLKSLHGIMTQRLWAGDPPRPRSDCEIGAVETSEIWSREESTRLESGIGNQKVVTIQKADIVYGIKPGETQGVWFRLPCQGLAKHSLVRQIEMIKQQGKAVDTFVSDGETYIRYVYQSFPLETADVAISLRSSLPLWWISIVHGNGSSASVAHTSYSAMEANVAFPDSLLNPPKGVAFVQKDISEFLAPKP